MRSDFFNGSARISSSSDSLPVLLAILIDCLVMQGNLCGHRMKQIWEQTQAQLFVRKKKKKGLFLAWNGSSLWFTT